MGIGIGANGVPIGLFTVNRWVTGETWFQASDIVALLDRYQIDKTEPSWPLNLWLTNMLILFRPTIEALIHERDQAILQWQRDHPEVENVYEDRNLEVTSYRAINLAQYVDELTSALEA